MSRAYDVVPVGQPRSPEWYAARRYGIGSSEAANVLGWGKYGSPLSVWLEKTGEPLPDHDTAQMRSGRYMEEAIARMWAEQEGRHIARPPALLRSRKWPCLQASVDFVEVAAPKARKPVAPVEVKAVFHADWRDWDSGAVTRRYAVPDHYIAQVIEQLIVLDVDRGYVAALIDGRVHSFEVNADRELREEYARQLTAWWERHVVAGERPPLDDPVLDRSLLARACPRPADDALDIAGRDDIAELVRLHAQVAAVKNQAKADWDAICNRLAVLTADHNALVWGDSKPVAWRNGARIYTRPDRLPAAAGLSDRTEAA